MLRCPSCSGSVHLEKAEYVGGRVENGELTCICCDRSYPIVGFIPRFVLSEDYTDTFGFQWNRFAKTQLDSCSGHPISRERFFRTTGWTPEAMKGKWVLDVGCGAGRFAEVGLSTGANIVALDYSNAVDACRDNLFPNSALEIIQGDIYQLPFRGGQFDFVYCVGVLQHTPDVQTAFAMLPKLLSAGGKLAVDVYPKLFRNILFSKYWVRPLTRKIKPAKLFALCERLVEICFPFSSAIGKIPVVGKKLRYLIPVANYEGVYPLSAQQQREWSLLDTFDMLSPKYDRKLPKSLNAGSRRVASRILKCFDMAF